MRLNDVKFWGSILSSILKTKIVIVNDCITDDSDLGTLYKALKSGYKIPTNFLSSIENDLVFKFFKSDEERINYINSWKKLATADFIPFSTEQYNFYLKLSLENQVYEQVETNHYLDNGCFCDACSIQRKRIFNLAVKEQLIHERMDHNKIALEYKKRIDKDNLNKAKAVKKINNFLKSKFKGRKIYNKNPLFNTKIL